MNGFCDLHVHSVFSDGTYTPAELIRGAETLGLSALALCDHNTVAGLPDFLLAAGNSPVEAVPGAEFSTDYRGTELHILGLFIQPRYFPTVTELLEDARQRKEESNLSLITALCDAGYALDYAKIREGTPKGQVNRAHIAAAMLEKGYVSSIQEAFQTILSPKYGLYQPPKRLSSFAAIEFIRSIHAVPVLAHPFLNLNEEALRVFLRQAKAYGLGGMETVYSLYDRGTAETAASVAREFGLRQSGGSDFHGANKPDISLGSGRGNLAVPLRFLGELKKEIQ
ncbi:MAG: PHP domain-containing protein [Oscillospiraceae bacterium]|nr:PHP domain-containing protein [Oscillospiraceae bacterium]